MFFRLQILAEKTNVYDVQLTQIVVDLTVLTIMLLNRF